MNHGGCKVSISSTSYNISGGNNQDLYPLMHTMKKSEGKTIKDGRNFAKKYEKTYESMYS
jgi:hypothetical protein